MAFTPDGKSVAVAGRYRSFHIVSLDDGRMASHGFSGWWWRAAFSPRDPMLVFATDVVEARSLVNGTTLWTAGPDRLPRVSAVMFTPTGDELMCFHSGEVSFLDPLTGTLVRKSAFPHISGSVRLSLSPDMTTLALQAGTNTEIYDLRSRERVATLNTGRRFFTDQAFHPDGHFFATTSNDRTVRVWDAATWKEVITFTWDVGKMRSVCFAPDGLRMAAGSDTGRVVVWDAEL